MDPKKCPHYDRCNALVTQIAFRVGDDPAVCPCSAHPEWKQTMSLIDRMGEVLEKAREYTYDPGRWTYDADQVLKEWKKGKT